MFREDNALSILLETGLGNAALLPWQRCRTKSAHTGAAVQGPGESIALPLSPVRYQSNQPLGNGWLSPWLLPKRLDQMHCHDFVGFRMTQVPTSLGIMSGYSQNLSQPVTQEPDA